MLGTIKTNKGFNGVKAGGPKKPQAAASDSAAQREGAATNQGAGSSLGDA